MHQTMSAIDYCLRNNAEYAAGFAKAELPNTPARLIAIVTCMDARLETGALLGLEEGDAHVIRNAGGVVTDDVIRSLAVSQRLLGTREIMVIQHTGCGMQTEPAADLHRAMRDETGVRPPFAIHAFVDIDLDDSVRRSVAMIKASPFVPNTNAVRGFVCDVATGRLREVE